MKTSPRYDVNNVEGDYYIYDTKDKPSSTTYLLMPRPVVQLGANYQLILAVYDAQHHVDRDYLVIDCELWSTYAWVTGRHAASLLVASVLQTLQALDIENPVELVAEYGGIIRGQPIAVRQRPVYH